MTRRANHRIDHVRCPGGGKVCFPTRAAAKDALRHMRAHYERRQQHADPRWKVYLCPTCAFWHVGTDLRQPPPSP